MRKLGVASLLTVLLAFGTQAAPIHVLAHSAALNYTSAACTANPAAPGCPGRAAAGAAFSAAAAQAAALAKQLRACQAAGGNCTALAKAFAAASAKAKALARKLGVPYTAPSTGGGGTYVAAGRQAGVTTLASTVHYSAAAKSGLNSVRTLPTTGGGVPPSGSPFGLGSVFLAALLALLGFGMRRLAARS
jgi:hypothetical protein